MEITNTGIDSRKLGMWVVIGSECLLFGTLIINYIIAVSRVIPADELLIKPANIFNILVTSASTFVLLMSSLAMVLSLAGLQAGDMKKFRFWCFGTAVLGACFLGFQVYEFTEFYLNGLGLGTNIFGSSFFVLTGTHGAHVFVGVFMLTVFGLWSYKGTIQPAKHSVVLETIGLYWHFVDVIWIVIFTVVYLFTLTP